MEKSMKNYKDKARNDDIQRMQNWQKLPLMPVNHIAALLKDSK